MRRGLINWYNNGEDPSEDPDDDVDPLGGYHDYEKPPARVELARRYRLKTTVTFARSLGDLFPYECKGLLTDTTGPFGIHQFTVQGATEAMAHLNGIEKAKMIIRGDRLIEKGPSVETTYLD